MKKMIMLAVLFSLGLSCSRNTITDYPVKPVPFTSVHFTDSFWQPRLETNRTVTIPFDFKKCEETGRIDNFAKAGGLMEGPFRGIRFDDSDVFKVMEGAAYSLSLHPDAELDKYMDDLIAKVAAAQEEDGYLYTTRTIDAQNPADAAGKTRWSYIRHSHELYNVGHMYEAAVAHYRATGKKTFLNIAIKSANLIESVFGPGKKYDVPGHEEIEIGLVKLYRVTGDDKYLKLSKFFLDQRGNKANRDTLYGEYAQDHVPVIEQDGPVGHAVRAGYLYSGMADIAALTGDTNYIGALNKIWENVAYKKLYLTGGIGARHSGEAFGEDYELPNGTAYNETCAAIANMLWNHRMFLLHGETKYMDVFERTLYNGFLSGISLSGDEFFYPNPLESDGSYQRSPWFNCSCCPSNVVRFLPSLPGYVYAQKGDKIYVNLFIQSEGQVKLGKNTVTLNQETNYPWDGQIRITVSPAKKASFAMSIRIPGWSQNQPVPGDLYSYLNNTNTEAIIKVNGEKIDFTPEKGYAVINRKWQKGDEIELSLPMQINKVVANENVAEDKGKLAIERGPVVYCAEAVDNGGQALNILLSENTIFNNEFRGDMLNGINILTGKGSRFNRTKSGQIRSGRAIQTTLIPYYAWAHRGQGEMTVWFPYQQ